MGKNLIFSALAVVGFFFGALQPAGAAITIHIVNGDGVVHITTSGSFNLDAVVNYMGQQSLEDSYINPQAGSFGLGASGAVADLFGSTIYDLAPFGSIYAVTYGAGTGDAFGLVGGGLGSPAAVVVPGGYVSGAPVWNTATIPGSIESLGLTLGSHVTTFSFEGHSDTVTVLVAVPEPGLTGLAVAAGLLALAGLRRGRAKS